MPFTIEFWSYPGSDEPFGYCAHKDDFPTKREFIRGIWKEYGELVTENEVEEGHAVRFGTTKYRFVGRQTPKSREVWITKSYT